MTIKKETSTEPLLSQEISYLQRIEQLEQRVATLRGEDLGRDADKALGKIFLVSSLIIAASAVVSIVMGRDIITNLELPASVSDEAAEALINGLTKIIEKKAA